MDERSPADRPLAAPPAPTPDASPDAKPDAKIDRSDLDESLRAINGWLVEMRLDDALHAATLKALVDTLVASGALAPHELEWRRQRALDAQQRALAERPTVRMGEAIDKYGLRDLPEIDCASLIALCKARCCTLTVVCSAQDLDERVVQWDYARPYELRKRADGYCAHSTVPSRQCGIYERRPAVCRTYDCRGDSRIWKDFAKRIPAD